MPRNDIVVKVYFKDQSDDHAEALHFASIEEAAKHCHGQQNEDEFGFIIEVECAVAGLYVAFDRREAFKNAWAQLEYARIREINPHDFHSSKFERFYDGEEIKPIFRDDLQPKLKVPSISRGFSVSHELAAE